MSDCEDASYDPPFSDHFIDFLDLTVDEMATFEDELGYGFQAVLAPRPLRDPSGGYQVDEDGDVITTVQIPMRALKVLIWLKRRRDNPTYSLDGAGTVSLGELIFGPPPDVQAYST